MKDIYSFNALKYNIIDVGNRSRTGKMQMRMQKENGFIPRKIKIQNYIRRIEKIRS